MVGYGFSGSWGRQQLITALGWTNNIREASSGGVSGMPTFDSREGKKARGAKEFPGIAGLRKVKREACIVRGLLLYGEGFSGVVGLDG